MGRRLCAFLLDVAIIEIAVEAAVSFGLTGLASFGAVVVFWPYRLVMHAWRGQTLGKIALRVRVQAVDNAGRPSLAASALRELAYCLVVLPALVPAWIATLFDLHGRDLAYAVVPILLLLPLMPMGFVGALTMMRFTSDRQTWADLAVHTRVVDSR